MYWDGGMDRNVSESSLIWRTILTVDEFEVKVSGSYLISVYVTPLANYI